MRNSESRSGQIRVSSDAPPNSPSLAVADSILSLSNIPPISDSVAMILELHFERFTTKFIDKFISDWSEEEIDYPSKDALLYLNKAINFSRNEFRNFLAEEYGDLSECSMGQVGCHDNLDVFSRHCKGDLKDDDQIWSQCRRLSVLSDEELRFQIGKYFSEHCESYITKKFPHLYSELEASSHDNNNEEQLSSRIN